MKTAFRPEGCSGGALRVGGIILAGGASRRMGAPKADLPFGDQTMLEHVAGVLATVTQPLVVVVAPAQQPAVLPAAGRIVHDARPGGGPLEGLAAGLRALAGEVDAAYVSGCDVPFLCGAFVTRMIELLGDARICVPLADGRRHPLAGVYRVEVLPTVERLLAGHCLSLQGLLQAEPTRFVTPEQWNDVDPSSQSLRNINTPAAYEAAVRERSSRE